MSSPAVDTTLLTARLVPPIALEWMRDAPTERWRIVDGSLVFADIAGFTALSERLAERGRIGAEELVETLSTIFGATLATAARRGGQLLKFGGDALLFLFPHHGHVTDACSTAVDMRRELRRSSEMTTSVGRLALSASIGVHTGPVNLFLVGETHRELIVAGPTTTHVLVCESTAHAGEIVVSDSTASLLPAQAVRHREDGIALLRWRTPRTSGLDGPPSLNGLESVARSLLPSMIVDQVDGTRPDPAHRTATICFMRFAGVDAMLERDGAAAVASRLDETLRHVQDAFAAEDVALLAVDCDADGGKIFCSSGVPLTSEDDEGRMLRAARRIIVADLPFPLQIGINRGHVFAAEVGYGRRAAFSAMGDTTNLAARICAQTPAGSVYVHRSVLDNARTVYESSPVGPFTFKGKSRPELLYELGDEVGAREGVGDDALPMLGRSREMDVLRGHIDAVARGEGGSVTVSGGLGVGKSRLIREAIGRHRTIDVLDVRAEPYGSNSPYRVFRDLVRGLLGIERDIQRKMGTTLHRSVQRMMPDRVALSPLLGDVAQVDVPLTDEVRSILPQFRADRTADVVVELLTRAYDGPLVIRVEDEHWVDDASARLIDRLRTETQRRPWLVLVVHRDDGTKLRQRPDDSIIALDPLGEATMRELALRSTEDAPRPPHEIDQLVSRAAGNPLFLFELIRAVRELGAVDAVPSSLQGAMAAQVDALDPFTRRVLAYASVFGRSFRRTTFRDALQAEDIEVDPATFERLGQFLEADGPDRWRFRSGIVRDVTYDGLGFRLRSRLHLAAGDVVERTSADREADAETLSLHFAQAADHARTYTYALIAADRAARAQANADAATQYERALGAARRLDHVDDQVRYRLLLALGEARERAGLLDAALAAYRSAAALRRGHSADQCDVRLRRARVHEMAGAYSVALAETTRVRSVLHDETGEVAGRLRARATAFASTVRVRQERPGEVLRLARSAALEAERWDDKEALARALSSMAWAKTVTGQGGGAVDARRALRLYREIGDLQSQAHMENNLGVQAYFEGQWTETLERYRRASEACRRAGDLLNSALTDTNAGEVLVNQGRLDEAIPLLRDAMRLARSLASPVIAGFAEMHLGRALMASGDLDQAEHLLETVVDLYRSVGSESFYEASLHLAALHVRAGHADQALVTVADASAQSSDELAVFAAAEAAVTTEALMALGRIDEARVRAAAGVEAARSMHLDYDLARLLVLSHRLGDRPEAWLGTDDPLAESERLYNHLGVIAHTGV